MRFRQRVLSRLALAILLCLALPAPAGEPTVARPTTLHLTLAKAIELALAKNFSIEVERFEPEIARERVTQELGRFDPNFFISGESRENTVADRFGLRTVRTDTGDPFVEVSRFLARTVTQTTRVQTGLSGDTPLGTQYALGLGIVNLDELDGLNNRYTGEATLSLSQPLLRGAGPNANLFQLRIARNNVLVSEWQLRAEIMNVINRTVAAYNDLQFAIEDLEVARGFRELALQLVADNSRRVEIGVMSPLNITIAKAEAASREERVILAERQILDRENLLKQLITRDLESLLDIRLEIEPPLTPAFVPNVRGAIADALQLRPDYRQAILDIERQNITLAFTKNDALPRFDLTGSLRLIGVDNDLGSGFDRIARRDQSAWSVGAIFSVPIPNREGRASVAAAKLRAAQALINLQQLEQQIVVEVDNANGTVTTARQRIASTAQARALAKESLEAGEERLRAGTGTTFEVLELQKKLSEAESRELSARIDYNKAVSDYYRRVGTILREHRVSVSQPSR